MSEEWFAEHPTCAALAASARHLSDVLMDAVRRAALRRRPPVQGELALDEGATQPRRPERVLRADDLAAAALLGEIFEMDRGVLARLQDPETVVVIEIPDPGFVAPVVRVLRGHVVTEVCDGAARSRSCVELFHDAVEERLRRPGGFDETFETAMREGRAVLGVSSDPEANLPRELVVLADRRFLLPRFRPATLAKVIHAATGTSAAVLPEATAAMVTAKTISLSVRGGLSAEKSRARLVRLAQPKKGAAWVPKISELSGYGDKAKRFGIELARDIRAASEGRLDWNLLANMLLVSAPGMGKTTYAQAVAAEAGDGIRFVSTSVGQWLGTKEGHLGNVVGAMRAAFAQAKRNAPAVLLLDEVDSLPARGTTSRDDGWWNAVNNALLECFERASGVCVVAACNRPEGLDPALVRSGRLDRRIDLAPPDVEGIAGIFRTHLKSDLPDADLVSIAAEAHGRTPADVERFVRDARARARHTNAPLTEALLLQIVRDGAPQISEAVKLASAYHEAGHAVVGMALGVASPRSMSLNARGGIIESDPGATVEETRRHFENVLSALLGGRAAQSLAGGEASVSAGAGGPAADSDLALATNLAIKLESTYGLGRTGLMWVPVEGPRDLLLFAELRAAVSETLDRAYAAAKSVLAANRAALDALAFALAKRGHLDRDGIRKALEAAPIHMAGSETTPAAAGSNEGPGVSGATPPEPLPPS